MDFPGKKLVIKLWETPTEKGFRDQKAARNSRLCKGTRAKLYGCHSSTVVRAVLRSKFH